MSTTLNKQQVLTKYWGFSSFREKQEEIIQAVLDGKDTLALLPTGGGKSICFQVPALMLEGLCLVVSPLIALMQDQVQNLKSKGIKALSITSAMSKREIDIALDNAAYGDFKFLYVSPERLETDLFKARLKKMKVNLVAIDEAHCISNWGYDFRPAYLNIAALREQLTDVPFLALTATATTKVVVDIQDKLRFKEQHLIQKSFVRNNLAYVVIKSEDQLNRMLKVIDGVKGSGIIYVNSRKKTKDITLFLRDHNISSDYYHAGLNINDRYTKQQLWIQNKTRIMVSTNAFGMGIDKPNVRFVIHLDLPESLEAYFQEAGRAGRDEKKAYAVLLLSPSMTSNLKERVEQNFPEIKFIKSVYLSLANYFQIPINGGEFQSYEFDIKDFCQRYRLDVFSVYQAIHFLEKENYISISENFAIPSRVFITVSKEDLYKFQVANRKYDGFIKVLLRSYGGLFENFIKISEFDLSKNASLSKEATIQFLERLDTLEILDYQKQSSQPKITYNQARLDQSQLIISKENYKDRKQIATEKYNSVINYVEEDSLCRSTFLLNYFGEKGSYRCGICDTCLERNKLDLNDIEFREIESQINQLLKGKSMNTSELISSVNGFGKMQVVKTLEFLLETDRIGFDGVLYSINSLN